VTTSIDLNLLGSPRTLEFEELDPDISPLTEQPLRRISIEVRVSDDIQADLSTQVNASRGTSGTPIMDGTGIPWQVDTMYSSHSGVGPWTYHLVLKQVERVQLKRLEFVGVSISLDKWVIETESEGRVVLECLATTDVATHAKIEAAIVETAAAESPYFSVRFVDVREAPMMMRFGQCVWQEMPDGARYRLVLVSQSGDKVRLRRLFNDPEVPALMRNSIRHSLTLAALLDELTTAGALTPEARTRIKERAEARPPDAWREYMRTDDIESYFSGDNES
jgi:hypothetical protein